ncbi:MAG: tetratricopeptide repeat protein [Chlamydiota bacterium]|nr:tetratricopeptide repeat protein [Chlamydiota bacterium]
MRKAGIFAASLLFVGLTSFLFAQDMEPQVPNVDRGKSLYENNQYQEAINVLEATLVTEPNNKDAQRYLKKSQKALETQNKAHASQSLKTGVKLYKQGNYHEAVSYLEEALIYDPGNAKAKKYRSKCLSALSIDEGYSELDMGDQQQKPSQESIANKQAVKMYYREGRRLFLKGYLEEAEEEFQKVLTLNPYHVPARRYLEQIIHEKDRLVEDKQRLVEGESMVEVRESWLPPVQEKVEVEVEIPWKTSTVTEARKKLLEKAEQVIPTINFNNAKLADVVRYLSQVSDINIVIDESVLSALSVTMESEQAEETTLAPEGSEEPVVQAMRPSIKTAGDRITISLKDVPLVEALKYILRAKGLRYLIEDYAIIIVSMDYVPPEDMVTRYYHLASGVGTFTSFDLNASDDEFSSEEGKKDQIAQTTTIKDILEESGVPWPDGSRIFLDQRTGTLIVRNTPTNIEVVEDILRALDVSPFQVIITARFVELENTDASDLGLEWILNDDLKMFLHEGSNNGLTAASSLKRLQFDKLQKNVGTDTLNQTLSGNLRYLTTSPLTGQVGTALTGNPNPILSISGILTRPEFSVVLHALDQKGKQNVLSSPQVTTINGQRAQIKVVQEYIYPTEYEVTPATTNSQGSVTTPPVVAPGAFETRDIGIVLDVTPNVGADRKTINLTIIPEVSEFVQWLDYGVAPQTFTRSDGIIATMPGYPILQPLFSTRTVTTSVIINDGDTVVLGGLIRDATTAYEDKIPLLGDLPVLGYLFKKKGQISIKKNLIIFVSAELITPTGEPFAPTLMESGETVVPASQSL